MHFTNDFSKALIRLSLLSLLIAALRTWLKAEGMLGFSIYEPNSVTRTLLNYGVNLLAAGAFWHAIAVATKELKGSLIAFLLFAVGIGAHYFLLREVQYNKIYSDVYFLIPYIIFGLLHFKTKKGLYLVIAYLAIRGISIADYSPEYYEIVNKFFHLVGMENLVELKIPTGERSYTIVYLTDEIIRTVFLPLDLLIFWFVYSLVKNKTMDISLRTTPYFKEISKLTFSLLFWIMRISLSVSIFGIIYYQTYAFDYQPPYMIALSLACYCLAIAIVGSFYRNFLSAYFVSLGKYPRWTYLLLNIPIINFFTWIFVLIKANSFSKTAPGESHRVDSVVVKRLQQVFVDQDRNKPIKLAFFLVLIVYLVVNLAKTDAPFVSALHYSVLGFIITAIVALGVLLWYLHHEKTIFVLFGFYSLLLVLIPFTNLQSGLNPAGVMGLTNIFIYYSLFHFDRLKFEEPLSDIKLQE